jgi:glycerol-3-phosphate cytidylyltransferase
MVVGYTTGVFDLFHVGHVNVLKNCKSLCDKLIVGVTIDELVIYKNKKAVIPFEERCEILRACKYVDVVVPQETMNKLEAIKRYKFNIMFVGDDWYGTDKWNEIEKEFISLGIKVVYFPYTKTTSSTLINETLNRLREK